MAAKELDSVVPRPKRDQCMKATKRLKTPNKESPFHPAPLLGGVGGGFIAPIHVRILEVFTIHEPYPLIPSFSPSGGEGARRAVEGDSDRFMAPTHVKTLEVFAIHEPVGWWRRLAFCCVTGRASISDRGLSGRSASAGRMAWE